MKYQLLVTKKPKVKRTKMFSRGKSANVQKLMELNQFTLIIGLSLYNYVWN